MARTRTHIQKQKPRRPKLRNWLTEMDKVAQKLPRAKNASDYWCFWFVRYPRLRPRGASSLKWLWDEIPAITEMITKDAKTQRAIEGLDKLQSNQLAALVLDSRSDLDDYDAKLVLRDSLQRAQSTARRLQRNMQKSRATLEELRNEAASLPLALGTDTQLAANKCINILAKCKPPQNETIGMLSQYSRSIPLKRRAVQNMVKLYWFFRHGCGLDGDESEVRVALIRNRFWMPWVGSVGYRPEYSDPDSKGCEAVHQAIRSFR